MHKVLLVGSRAALHSTSDLPLPSKPSLLIPRLEVVPTNPPRKPPSSGIPTPTPAGTRRRQAPTAAAAAVAPPTTRQGPGMEQALVPEARTTVRAGQALATAVHTARAMEIRTTTGPATVRGRAARLAAATTPTRRTTARWSPCSAPTARGSAPTVRTAASSTRAPPAAAPPTSFSSKCTTRSECWEEGGGHARKSRLHVLPRTLNWEGGGTAHKPDLHARLTRPFPTKWRRLERQQVDLVLDQHQHRSGHTDQLRQRPEHVRRGDCARD